MAVRSINTRLDLQHVSSRVNIFLLFQTLDKYTDVNYLSASCCPIHRRIAFA